MSKSKSKEVTRWDIFRDWFFKPLVQGLGWGLASHGTALLLTSLWYRWAGVSVCAECANKHRSS